MLLHDFFDIKKPKIKEDSWHGGGDEPKDAWHSEAGVVEGRVDSPVSSAITRRILNQRHDLLKFGPQAVMDAIDQVAEWVGEVEEIGSGDVSVWVAQVARYLQTQDGQGVAEGLPGEFIGGTAGGIGGAVVGNAVAGPMGALVGGAAGGTAGQIAGRELTDEQKLNEIAPLLAAGARLFMAAAPKIAQVFGKVGQAGARGVGQAAKAGAGIAAKNAGQIGVGVGAYEIGSSVADMVKDIAAAVGTAVDEKTIFDLATLAFKYAIPAGIVLAILYGGKKAIDSLFADPKTPQGVVEGGMPSSVSKRKQQYDDMSDKAFAELHQSKADNDLVAMAWRHGYGKGSLHYVNKRKRGKQGVAEGEIAEVNDEWFKQGAFKTFKKAAPVKYQLAQQPGTVDTLEGPVRYEAGHYIMTGPKGERYPISPDKFNTLYDDNGDGTATPKKISKLAKLADHDGVLHTSWGDLQYTKGNDYIVRHGTGDYGAVKKDIFAQTYDNLGQGVAEGNDGYDDESTRDEYTNLQSGDYVRDSQDSSGEVFIMRGQPDDRRVRIEDKDGRGWNIAPYRLIAVDPNDQAIGRYFNDMNEASAHAKQVAAKRKEYDKVLGKFEPTDNMVGTAKMIKDIATSNASPEHKKAAIDALNKKGVAEGMFTKGPAIDPIIGKQINDIINRLHNHAKQTKDEYLKGAADELFDILKNTGGTYSVPGSPGIRDVAEDEMADFIAGGGKITQVPFKPPRKGERLGGSRHIGGRGDTPTSRHKGISANTQGNKVIGLTKRVAETKADYRIKSIGTDSKGDYYISPSTGKKVYRKAKVGDHENPKTGEHKGVSEGANYWTKLQDTRSKKINSLVDELEKSIQ